MNRDDIDTGRDDFDPRRDDFDPGRDDFDPGRDDLQPTVDLGAPDMLATDGPAMNTATARALRSERFFWWRLTALLALASAVGVVGVWKVRERSQGIRVAQKLAVVDSQLREAVETNLTLEAQILRELDPVALLKQGVEEFDMAAGDPDEAVVVP